MKEKLTFLLSLDYIFTLIKNYHLKLFIFKLINKEMKFFGTKDKAFNRNKYFGRILTFGKQGLLNMFTLKQ